MLTDELEVLKQLGARGVGTTWALTGAMWPVADAGARDFVYHLWNEEPAGCSGPLVGRDRDRRWRTTEAKHERQRDDDVSPPRPPSCGSHMPHLRS